MEMLLGRSRVEIEPGKPRIAALRQARAARRRSGDSAAAFHAPTGPSRQISPQRLRLDRDLVYPEPSDLDPTIQIGAYPFALAYLLKRPWGLSDLTRGPTPFKNNYAEVLFLAFYPLSFFKIGPAVQVRSFYELDPEALV